MHNIYWIVCSLYRISQKTSNRQLSSRGKVRVLPHFLAPDAPPTFLLVKLSWKIGMVTNQDTRNPEIMLPKLENNGKMGYWPPKRPQAPQNKICRKGPICTIFLRVTNSPSPSPERWKSLTLAMIIIS